LRKDVPVLRGGQGRYRYRYRGRCKCGFAIARRRAVAKYIANAIFDRKDEGLSVTAAEQLQDSRAVDRRAETVDSGLAEGNAHFV
jgi:hypothetical protein